jgi:hypothetical protein
VAEQYRTKYFDFTAKHFHKALKKQLPLRVYLDEIRALRAGAFEASQGGRAAPQEASALALAGDACVSGRLHARLVFGQTRTLRFLVTLD